MYRMRVVPPPLSVTRPPPSITISGPVSLKTFAGRSSSMTTGSGPQSNVITPPPATASMNASPVQLAGVPSPTTVVGFETFSRPASAGISQCPSGLPAGGPSSKTGGSPPVEPELSEPPELPEPVVELSLPLVLSPPVEPVVPVVSSEPVLPVLPVPAASPLDDPHPEDVDPS